MNLDIDNLKLYLPQYLSAKSYGDLIDSIKQFPDNFVHKFYTNKIIDTSIIYQGDGLKDFFIINLPDTKIDKARVMVISNTCDIDESNERIFESKICYCPIFSLAKYENMLNKKWEKQKVQSHIESIKQQYITQIFYLPASSGLGEDSIVFLDRISNCSVKFLSKEKISESRLFSLSDYGFYLLLTKISIHFTRIQEHVERGSIV